MSATSWHRPIFRPLRQLLSRRGRRRLLHGVDWGSLRRLNPVSQVFGFDRGTPVDRFYIERFLQDNRDAIRGRVLEIGDSHYTRKFGHQVTVSDVLHAVQGNAAATLVGDLATGRGVPRDVFDCFILTQTLHTIEDFRGALHHAHLALRPGGVLLATLPGITRVSRYDMDRWGDFWRFTSLAVRRVFEQEFGTGQVIVQAHGNLLAATAFLQGIAAEELQDAELLHEDPDFEVLLAVRAERVI